MAARDTIIKFRFVVDLLINARPVTSLKSPINDLTATAHPPTTTVINVVRDARKKDAFRRCCQRKTLHAAAVAARSGRPAQAALPYIHAVEHSV